MGKIMWADQSIETFKHLWIAYTNEPTYMVSFGSNGNAIDQYASIYLSTFIIAIGEPRRRCAMEISVEAISPSSDTSDQGLMSGRYCLVESARDLLLVTKLSGFTLNKPVVRRMCMQTHTIDLVSSIDSRALFDSHGRCLMINAEKFSSIQCGYIYLE